MCKLHGVRLTKGIKIFESMLQHQLNWSILLTKKSELSFVEANLNGILTCFYVRAVSVYA